MTVKYSNMEVQLLDVHGTDTDIYRSARLSYDGFEDEVENKNIGGLIRYLWFYEHTSPFEQVTLRFYIKIPIYVMRQLVRHRTASLNELSRRYRSDELEFYRQEFRKKDTALTKQGSGEFTDLFDDDVHNLLQLTVETYNEMISHDIAPETARSILPTNLMTKVVWQINLRNFFHFHELRSDSHAQKEIREVADMMFDQVYQHVPISCRAYIHKKLLKQTIKTRDIYDIYKQNDDSKLKDLIAAQKILGRKYL